MSGLFDEDIQCEVLSNDRTLKTFDSKFQYIEGLEKGGKTKTQFHKETSVGNAFKYKNETNNRKTRKFTSSTTSSTPCKGCGWDEHGTADRSPKCPAWGQTCHFCGKINHFKKVCTSFDRQKQAETRTRKEVAEPTNRIFDIYAQMEMNIENSKISKYTYITRQYVLPAPSH